MNASHSTPEALLVELRGLLGERCRTDAAALKHAGRQVSHHSASQPNVVVIPNSEREVQEIVKLCAKFSVIFRRSSLRFRDCPSPW
jgi:hypothetical protein